MANEGPSDDFIEQILGFPGSYDSNLSTNSTVPSPIPMMFNHNIGMGLNVSGYNTGLGIGSSGFPLGLSLEQGKTIGVGFNDGLNSSTVAKRFHNDNNASSSSSLRPGFRGQTMQHTVPSAPHPPAIRPRVRARRGQATDPHSIAERLRRERIAERIRALQDLVPSVNKTDRAAMLDEIVDYVKFLRLQVKVLSVSRLGGASAVAPLVTDIPISAVEDEGNDGGRSQPAWEKWSNDGTERQVAKLMEENVGAAMQFLQSKALCIMPISLASAIYHTQPLETATNVKPEPTPPS